MTQHFLTPKNPEQADVIMVGWDGMLDSFFAQVYKQQTDDDPVWVLWEGCTHRQLSCADEVLGLVSDYAHIPEGLQQTLFDDRAGRTPYNGVTCWSATGRHSRGGPPR